MGERVYIIDDEAMIRRMLKRALDHAGMLTRTFDSGDQLLEAIDDLEPGVMLLDIRMPGRDGLQVLDALGGLTRVHGVLMLSSHGDVSTAVRAIQAGAIDFIEKPFSTSHLVERVKQVHETVRSRQSERTAAMDAEVRVGILSEREKEVGRELTTGQTNKEIAKKLGLSPRTVEAHRARLMKKLDVTSVAEIVRIFVATKL